jgi:hypothetical protein
MYLQKVSRKTFLLKLVFMLASCRSMTKIAGSGSISQRHRSVDPDPHQNVMDPEHCLANQVIGTEIGIILLKIKVPFF